MGFRGRLRPGFANRLRKVEQRLPEKSRRAPEGTTYSPAERNLPMQTTLAFLVLLPACSPVDAFHDFLAARPPDRPVSVPSALSAPPDRSRAGLTRRRS